MQRRNGNQIEGVSKLRKPHTKSRVGCISCKKRRIKCDEQRPICGHCKRHTLSCEYKIIWFQSDLNSTPTSKSHSTPSSSRHAWSVPPATAPPTSVSTEVTTTSNQPSVQSWQNISRPVSANRNTDHWSDAVGGVEFTPGAEAPYVATPTLDTNPAQYFSYFNTSIFPLNRPSLELHSVNDGSRMANISMEDMEIFYFFLTNTVPTLCNSEEKVKCWRSNVPYLAFRDPALLHALLATAALHMYIFYREAIPAKLQLAMHHYNIFSRLMLAGDLENLNCGKAPAMFAASVLVTFYVLASAALSQSSDPSLLQLHNKQNQSDLSSQYSAASSDSASPPSTYISSPLNRRALMQPVIPVWVPFLKGLQAVTKQNYQELSTSPIAPLLDPLVDFFRAKNAVMNDPNARGRNREIWDRVTEPLVTREKILDEDYHLGKTEFDTYVSAINWLLVVNVVNGYMENSGFSTLLWALLVPSEYFQYLQQARPRALVIFALHSVLMHELSSYWWQQEGALKELDRLELILVNSTTPQMSRLIQYARQSLLDNIEIRRPRSDLESYRLAW